MTSDVTSAAEQPEQDSGGAETAAQEIYERLRSKQLRKPYRARAREPKAVEGSEAFMPGRDARGLSDVLDALVVDLGWQGPLAESDLLAAWPGIVGPETAAKTTPLGVKEGTLVVTCASTAWATQLRMMSTEILTAISRELPHAEVTALRFLGPDAPSWKRGKRSVPGRGPRDTYG